MENQIQILIDEIKQIRSQYVDEVGPGGGKAWPKAIKNRVLELDRLVNSTKETADACGLSVDTIYAWRSEAKKANFKQLSIVNKKSVTVTDTKSQKAAKISDSSSSVTVTVTTPKGFKIEGLSQDLIIEFLIKIGAR